MSFWRRRVVAALVIVAMTGVAAPLAAQSTGRIAGKATDEIQEPFSKYVVQLRDAASGQIVATVPLTLQGQFAFTGVALAQRVQVVLFDNQRNDVVCTEGPFELTTGAPALEDVNIDCGGAAAALLPSGIIAGRATAEAHRPFGDYAVQLRNAATGRIDATMPLDSEGRFSFDRVAMSERFLVELFNTREHKLVCTEGPYVLAAEAPSRTDVNIDCGLTPAAYWLLAAGAGTAAALAIVTTSASQ